MLWGSRPCGRTVGSRTLVFFVASFTALGLWMHAAFRRTDGPPRVLGTTIWSGSLSFPSGYTVAPGQLVELNPNANTTLDLGGNLIVQGTLRSWPAAGITHTVRFSGINEAGYVGGGGVPVGSDKGLWVTGAGRLDIMGAAKLPWTRAASGLAAGATSASLEAVPAGWKVGDEVLIAPTEKPNVNGFSTHHEVRTITALNGFTVSFAALSYPHPRVTVKPGKAFGAEVVNLTRNVRIEGQDATHRAHVWMKSSVPQSIRFAAVRYMGPQKGSPPGPVLGRYGLHFHQAEDGARGSLVEGVVVRQTGAVAYAAHRSHGITFRNTVAFDTQDVAYWYDAGASEAPNDTLYDGAVAAFVRQPPNQSGYRLSGFRLAQGTGNACLRCVAFGVQGNVGASGFEWPEMSSSVWRFEDSVSHDNRYNGIFVWQNSPNVHLVERFTGYFNGNAGIEHGAYTNEYHFKDNALYGNKVAGVILHAETLQDPPATSFQKPYIDGAGITANAVLLAKPTVVDRPPVLWCGATITGLTGSAYLINYTGADSTLPERLAIQSAC